MTPASFSATDVQVINRVGLARSTDPARWQLTGIFLDAKAPDGYWHAVATDGKQLATARLEARVEPGQESRLLPAELSKALATACRAKSRAERTTLELEETAARVLVRGESDSRFTYLDGTYPDYRVALMGAPLFGAPPTFRRVCANVNPQYVVNAHRVLGLELMTTEGIASGPGRPVWFLGRTPDRVTCGVMPLVFSTSDGEAAAEEERFHATWPLASTDDVRRLHEAFGCVIQAAVTAAA